MADRNQPTDQPDRIKLWVLASCFVIVIVAVLGVRLINTVGAQTALVTDYTNYPATAQAQLPAGCDGGGLFHSEQFSLNGSAPVSDPHNLPAFHEGDTLTMTWDATTQACVGAPVALVIKVAQDPVFDPHDDQYAYVPFAEDTADGGPGSLSYPLPPLESFGFNCAFQLDAIVGLPLAVVGPSGSDYSPGNRAALGKPGSDDRTTLIAYRNGAYEACAAEATTTTSSTVPDTTTSTAPEVTTTTASEVTTTTAPVETTTTTAPVETTTTVMPAAPATEPRTLNTAAAAAPAARSLANTGRNTLGGIALALFCVVAGIGVLVAGRIYLAKRQGVR